MTYQLIHGDCLDVLPTLEAGSIDAVVTDPPYGLGEKWTGGGWFQRGVYNGVVSWDAYTASDAIATVVRMKVPSVIWGGNYYEMPASRCWLIWQKTNNVATMADFEMAWTNLDMPSKQFSRPCNGWARQHPTEKPLDIMRWCIRLATQPGDTILDPFMGSGSTIVAAIMEGRNAIGIEIDKGYYDIACRRCADAAAQPRLLDIEPASLATQGELI